MPAISKNSIIIGAACVIAAGSLWYLSQDKDEIRFDSNVHTLEKLRKLVRELFVSEATIYCSRFVMITNLKKSGELTQE
jgi:hypothetical protein